MHIEVVYALSDKQKIYRLQTPEGVTAREAVALAPVIKDFPQADLLNGKIGIFGKAVADTKILKDGDRVEIYRPLIADPKVIRKKRAAEGKRMKKGSGMK